MAKAGTRTIDASSSVRCMVVDLTPEQETACRRALFPVEFVRATGVREACTIMSVVLPLLVIVDEAISDADRLALAEFTTACGAEIVMVERTPTAIASRLLEALRVAERRRLGAL